MIWYAISATAIAGVAAWATIRAVRKSNAWQRKWRESEATAVRLRHIIQRQQEVRNEANRQRREIFTGTDRERFDASVDILSDGDAGGDRDRD